MYVDACETRALPRPLRASTYIDLDSLGIVYVGTAAAAAMGEEEKHLALRHSSYLKSTRVLARRGGVYRTLLEAARHHFVTRLHPTLERAYPARSVHVPTPYLTMYSKSGWQLPRPLTRRAYYNNTIYTTTACNAVEL